MIFIMKIRAAFFFVLFLFLAPQILWSKVSDRLSLNGTLWTKFTYDMSEGADPDSGFDVHRGFLDIKYQHDEHWSTFLRADSKTANAKVHLIHQPTSEPNTNIFTAYIQRKGVFHESDVIRMGRVPHLYLGELYKILGTRWLSQTLSQEMGYLGSQVNGLSYWTLFGENFSGGYTVHDGTSGYGKVANNKTASQIMMGYSMKDFGLLLSGEISKSRPSTGVSSQFVMSGAFYYKSSLHKVALEWAHRDFAERSPELAYGVTGAGLFYQEKLGFYLRYFTGDQEFKSAQKLDSLLGLGPYYKWSEEIQSALIYEKRKAQKGLAVNDTETVSLLLSAQF